MKTYRRLFLIILSILSAVSISAQSIQIYLTDGVNGEVVPDAAIYLGQGENAIGTISNDAGYARLTSKQKETTLSISHLNYHPYSKALTLRGDTTLHIALKPLLMQIHEVVVTANESKEMQTSSVIQKDAMQHLQPSSFSDIVALLPGNGTKTPSLTSANLIQIREVGSSDDNYATSSLGTSFIMDGAPISTDANMQYVNGSVSGDHDYARSTANKGVDMRQISTDEIEKVEIVRGIPSVEYGDLTSGLVKIERKMKATPWEARFKSDGFGKLFYVGKGFSFRQEQSTLNFGVDYLDAKSDPRNTLENYKRITASIRLNNNWKWEDISLNWKINADYTASIDNDKEDPDLNYMKEDSYRSSYQKIGLFNQLTTTFNKIEWLRSIELLANVSYQQDEIRQTRFVAIDRDRPVPSNNGAGEHDGQYLPYTYVASHRVEGKPVNVYVKAKGNFEFNIGPLYNKAIAGIEWKMDKNYGDGQVYDLTRPLFVGISTRPRTYHEIPAGHQLSFFLEDNINWVIGRNQFKMALGIRGTGLPNLNESYAMHRKVYVDPRLNIQWRMPGITIKDAPLHFSLSGGIGKHSKMPTLLQLYPDKYYKDIIQLNYFHTNPEYRKLNLMTYVIDPTNYNLKPAENTKWEVRLGAEWKKHNLSVTYFREHMTSGFRSTTICMPFEYKKYDTSGIDANTITQAPQTSELPYTLTSVLGTYSQVTNGSLIEKEGIEFQYASPRFKSIKTRFTLNGAWFHTTYTNSQPTYYAGSTKVIEGVSVNDLYIGYYNWTNGSVKELFNTNVIADTHFEKLGLTFSTTLQLQWYSNSRQLERNGVPIAYMNSAGEILPYTEADQSDPYLQWLIVKTNAALYRTTTVPFAAYVNFKASKQLTRYFTIAFFVDKLFDILPDYQMDGITIRRSATPYFGMEVNLKI